jgi:hypothetical protein
MLLMAVGHWQWQQAVSGKSTAEAGSAAARQQWWWRQCSSGGGGSAATAAAQRRCGGGVGLEATVAAAWKCFCAAQKSLILFCAAHRNKQKYFNTFALLWDDTKRSNCPGRASFAKARYMKSFSLIYCMKYPLLF